MPGVLAWAMIPSEILTFVLALVLAVLVGLIAWQSWKESRVTPEERERQRRAMLMARGKMGDATLAEIREDHLFYTYAVRGVEYTASQDVSQLKQFLPEHLSVDCPVSVRYDPRNPANSIVVAEQWSGLRASKVS